MTSQEYREIVLTHVSSASVLLLWKIQINEVTVCNQIKYKCFLSRLKATQNYKNTSIWIKLSHILYIPTQKQPAVSVLGMKRSNIITIALSSLPPPRLLPPAIYSMDSSVLDREDVQVQERSCPPEFEHQHLLNL